VARNLFREFPAPVRNHQHPYATRAKREASSQGGKGRQHPCEKYGPVSLAAALGECFESVRTKLPAIIRPHGVHERGELPAEYVFLHAANGFGAQHVQVASCELATRGLSAKPPVPI
jgi:hypothetical protein